VSESDSQIDEAILSVAVASWRKVASVIVRAQEKLGNALPQDDTGLDLISERIEVLVQEGRLLAQGNIKIWRHSEVRKPA